MSVVLEVGRGAAAEVDFQRTAEFQIDRLADDKIPGGRPFLGKVIIVRPTGGRDCVTCQLERETKADQQASRDKHSVQNL